MDEPLTCVIVLIQSLGSASRSIRWTSSMLARKSGMTVVLDAKIERQEYRRVNGSVIALERFVELAAMSLHEEMVEHD